MRQGGAEEALSALAGHSGAVEALRKLLLARREEFLESLAVNNDITELYRTQGRVQALDDLLSMIRTR